MRTSKQRKFTVGEFITDPQQVVDAVKSGRWIWFSTSHARVYSAAWISNMNFGCVMSYIRSRQLALAIRNPEYPYVFRAKLMESHVPEKSSEWWVTCSEIPSARITEITKESAINSACAAAARHVNGDVRVHVVFEVPEHKIQRAKELMP